MPADKTADTRKSRHAIMRLLQRADWALQEDDIEDALAAVIRAIRAANRIDAFDRPDDLSAVLGKAVEAVLDFELDGDSMNEVLRPASAVLIREGENFRGCDYGT